MDYPKSVPNVGLVNGKFVDENAATGQVGSLIPAAWGNSVTSEILNVLSAASIKPDEQSTDQLSKAIAKIIAESSVAKEDLNKKADKTYVDDLTRQLLHKTGGVVSGPIHLNNGTDYSPQLAMKTPGLDINMDLADKNFRIFSNYGGETVYPLVASLPTKVVYFFGNVAWHAGNFNPANKADAAAVNQATESARGTAKVGSQAQINAGADDEVFVSPKKMRWGFAASLAANGYIVFPTWLGGFVLQWGYTAESQHGTDYRPFTIPFPVACFGMVLNLESASSGGFALNTGIVTQIIDQSKFLWDAGGTWGGGGLAYYLAWGK